MIEGRTVRLYGASDEAPVACLDCGLPYAVKLTEEHRRVLDAMQATHKLASRYPKILTREAAALAEQERKWTCATCNTMIEETAKGPYCRTCEMYWEDVRSGAFDMDDWYWGEGDGP